jgi:uncharacterized protein YggU (UPF0235/DUF167 family)
MLHATMVTITVRVKPRSGRTEVLRTTDGSVDVHVRAAPEGGRAAQEASDALARALGVPRSAVRLVKGARSRTKVFGIDGLDAATLQARLREG